MSRLDIQQGQVVQVPAVQLTNGQPFQGTISASDGETLKIAIDPRHDSVGISSTESSCVLCWEKDGIRRSCPIRVLSSDGGVLVCQAVIQEKRESPRLRIDVGLTYKKVPADQVKQAAEEVMARVNCLEEPESESLQLLKRDEDPMAQLRGEVVQLREMLTEVMDRLETLTAMVSGTPLPAQSSLKQPLAIQNCSGTGIGFVAGDPLDEGQYLRLAITLRTMPQTKIDCLGVVVRCAPIEGEGEKGGVQRHDVGVHYTHLHQNDREHLIHYLFKVQRRMLRDRKEAREAIA